MSKHKVLKSFTDKETHIGYNAGNTFESEDLERVSFLSEKGFIQAPSTNNENNGKDISQGYNENNNTDHSQDNEDNKNAGHSQDTDEPTIKQLKTTAKELGLDGFSKLNKDELIVAIEKAEAEKVSD